MSILKIYTENKTPGCICRSKGFRNFPKWENKFKLIVWICTQSDRGIKYLAKKNFYQKNPTIIVSLWVGREGGGVYVYEDSEHGLYYDACMLHMHKQSMLIFQQM